MTVLSAVPGYKNAAPIIALSYLDLYVQNLGVGTLWTDAALKQYSMYLKCKKCLVFLKDIL